MKNYAIILTVLIAIGIALTVQFLTQGEKLDQTVFRQTTESIRNLQALDKSLQVLLAQSQLNTSFEHEQLNELNYQISEEFDKLRYDALFEEIESSESLSAAVDAFDRRFIRRDEMLTDYIQVNQFTTASLATLRAASAAIQEHPSFTAESSITAALMHNQDQLFDLLLEKNWRDPLSLKPLAQLETVSANAPPTLLSDYNDERLALSSGLQATGETYTELIDLDIGELLDAIENAYTSYHNQAISGSNALKNGLVAYGITLLLALMFFAWQIRRNYVSLELEVAARTLDITTAYDELRESQEQLIQSEKMASLGQMVAGVAHEINTPLGYVNSNAETLKQNLAELDRVIKSIEPLITAVKTPQRDNRTITNHLINTLKTYTAVEAPDLIEESHQLLNDGLYGLSEISNLVRSLKDFARLDRQQAEQIDLNDCLNNSLTIASNAIREHQTIVVRQFANLPKISCQPSKLNQLFLNIITNACQSMQEPNATLTVSSSIYENEICIKFVDQGIGMSEQTQQQMFDPFFTSKEIGVGTGLGMSIAYKIIEAHNARITVDSEVGKGTSISVFFPTEAPFNQPLTHDETLDHDHAV